MVPLRCEMLIIMLLQNCTFQNLNYIYIFRFLGDSPASEFYVPTFWNTLSVIGGVSLHYLRRCNSVPPRWHLKFRRRRITQKTKKPTFRTCRNFAIDIHKVQRTRCNFSQFFFLLHALLDRLCGLVVRVSGYRYRGLGFDSRRYRIF